MKSNYKSQMLLTRPKVLVNLPVTSNRMNYACESNRIISKTKSLFRERTAARPNVSSDYPVTFRKAIPKVNLRSRNGHVFGTDTPVMGEPVRLESRLSEKKKTYESLGNSGSKLNVKMPKPHVLIQTFLCSTKTTPIVRAVSSKLEKKS